MAGMISFLVPADSAAGWERQTSEHATFTQEDRCPAEQGDRATSLLLARGARGCSSGKTAHFSPGPSEAFPL